MLAGSVAVAMGVSMAQAAVINVSRLLDDPTFTENPDSLPSTSARNTWTYDSRDAHKNVKWIFDASGTDTSTVHSFNAGAINLQDHSEVVDQPGYNVNTTMLTGISANFVNTDFQLSATAVMGAKAAVEAWYTVTINTSSGTFIGTSEKGLIFDKNASNNGASLTALVSAWNQDISWDADPFESGGIIYADILDIDLDIHGQVSSSNSLATGNSYFTIKDVAIGYESSIMAVPEPSSSTLLGLGSLTLSLRRRR